MLLVWVSSFPGGGGREFVGFRGCRKGGGFWLRGKFADVFACLQDGIATSAT